ncbi:MAG: hypothetical protein EXR75_02630 [Myxococcales bacterium]|nr:hypothetical protein [Myxococcales bacterium]
MACSGAAHAESMDPALGRLVLNERCRTSVGGVGEYYDPAAGFQRCLTNDQAFAKLVAQLGAGIAPIPTSAARTTGFGGYRVGFQASYTTIDSDAPYWKDGTEGEFDSSSKQYSVRNGSPASVLQLYAVRLAKGLPFGFEVAAGFGYLGSTGIVSGGGDVRLALFEGFRQYVPGFLPDFAVGGSVRTITGTPDLRLTVAAAEGVLSKPIPIAGSVVLSPRVGYQWLHIFGDSGLVDLTPNTDATALCGYQGDNTPAHPDPSKTAFDGQPVCSGSAADFNNSVVFDNVRMNRHRISFGADLRFQMIALGVNVVTDVVPPAEANTDTVAATDPIDPSGQTTFVLNPFADDPRTPEPDEVKSQWTISVELGAVF